MSKVLLEVKNLNIFFQTQKGLKPGVKGMSFVIKEGESFALLGESGCGKSLTAFSILQLLPENALISDVSEVYFENENLLDYSEHQMASVRGLKIGMIFQEPMSALNPVMTVGHQIEEVIQRHNPKLSKKVRWKRVLELMQDVEISEPASRSRFYPHQLSGGMKQRILIAMALAHRPKLLIADEPTTALDVTIQSQILKLLKKLQSTYEMSLLFITHDLAIASEIADTIGIMYAGHLVELASKNSFFRSPQHPYSQHLIEALPSFEKRHKLLPTPGEAKITHMGEHCRFQARCPFVFERCRLEKTPWISSDENHKVRCCLYLPEEKKRLMRVKAIDNGKNNEKPPIEILEIETHEFQHSQKALLHVESLSVRYRLKNPKNPFKKNYFEAVRNVNFSVYPGKTLAIVGESGCGKTTLAKTLIQLISPACGEFFFEGQSIKNAGRAFQRYLRRSIQIIFQDPYAAMNPRWMVGDLISEGLALYFPKMTQQERNHRLDVLLDQVGLSGKSKFRYPHEFSGGQRQRINIARALALDPKLIICDEPTSALDVSVQAQILNLLQQLQKEKGFAYLFITHNLGVVSYLADEVAVMRRGEFLELGSTAQVLHHPKNAYTQTLLAAVPQIVTSEGA